MYSAIQILSTLDVRDTEDTEVIKLNEVILGVGPNPT